MLPESFLEELKYKSDIEQTISSYVTLKRRGHTLNGLCPFHSEKSPSFTVYPDTQSYYCFGCGNGGDVITFIRQVENLEYMEAVRLLAQRSGMNVPEDVKDDQSAKLRTRVLEINRETGHFYHQMLLGEKGGYARSYLLDRGLTPKTIRHFGVGYAPEGWSNLKDHLLAKGFSQKELLAAAVVTAGKNNSVYDVFRQRIIFPIIDLRGNVIGFGGRNLQETGPKYLNSGDTPVFKKSQNLFALNFAKNTGQDTLLLGEGYMDVIAMHQGGFSNSVATLGTSLTAEQARLISRYAKKVVIAYDSDEAGQKAAKRAVNLFSQTSVSVSILQMSGAKDPDEYIKKFGPERFQSLIDGGKSAVDFEIDKLKQQFHLEIPEEKAAFLDQFCQLMAGINNDLLRDVYISQIANEMEVGRERLSSATQSIRKRRSYTQRKKESHHLASSAGQNIGTNPQKYKNNLSGLAAQEMLLTMLFQHPDYFEKIDVPLTPEDFSDEGYRSIWNSLSLRLANQQPIDLIHLSQELPGNLMGVVSQMLLKGKEISFTPQMLPEYINALKKGAQQKSPQDIATMSPEEYRSYLQHLQSEKR